MDTIQRFSYYDEKSGKTYVGEAEVTEQHFEEEYEYQGGGTCAALSVHVVSCWEIGLLAPRKIEFAELDKQLAREIDGHIQGEYTLPSGTEIELPSDWDVIEVLDTEQIHTCKIKAAIPDIKTDAEAETHGLSTVRRVLQIGPDEYRVHTRGPVYQMQKELRSIILF